MQNTNLQQGELPEVDYSSQNFKGSNIKILPPTPKQYTQPNGQPGSYHEARLLCNYGTPEEPFSEQGWRIEYDCGVWSDGIRTNDKTYTKKDEKTHQIITETITTYQVKITFDRRNDDQMRLVDKLAEGHLGVAQAIVDSGHAMTLGARLLDASSNDKAEPCLKRLVYYPRDKTPGPNQGKVMEGVNYSQFVSLKGSPTSDRHTTFVGIDGKEIPWAILKKCDFFWIPLVNHSHIYAGGNMLSIQRKVESGIVLKIKERDGAARQQHSLKRYQTAIGAEAQREFAKTIAAIEDSSHEDKELESNLNQTPNQTPNLAGTNRPPEPAPLGLMSQMASGNYPTSGPQMITPGTFQPATLVPAQQTTQPIPTIPQQPTYQNPPQPAAPMTPAQPTYQNPPQPATPMTPAQTTFQTIPATPQQPGFPNLAVTPTQQLPPTANQQLQVTASGTPQPGGIPQIQQMAPHPSTAAPPTVQYASQAPGTPTIPVGTAPQTPTGVPSVPGGIPNVPGMSAPNLQINN